MDASEIRRLTSRLLWSVCFLLISQSFAATNVSIEGDRWFINGRVTYPGSECEGLLMNTRMVNVVFEDTARADIQASEITERFIKKIPEYVAQGVRAFTLGLQGGFPGYEGAVNSAFRADGSLNSNYMVRVARVIEACDRAGVVVILGCYYQRQDQLLEDVEAIRNGVKQVVSWSVKKKYQNVLLEISNEYRHRGFDHEQLKSDSFQIELIQLARSLAPNLLVSTSGMGSGQIPDSIAEASDFVLIHFNTTRVESIPDRIAALQKFGKPIVCNEDDKLGADAVQALERCVKGGASWGFMHSAQNQYFPFKFQGRADDPLVYDRLKQLSLVDLKE